MKRRNKFSFFFWMLGTVFLLSFTDSVTGQTFSNLFAFPGTSGPSGTNTTGSNPYDTLILGGNFLFGTAGYGGTSGKGTVFRLNANGTGYTNLHSFSELSGPASTNVDGASPHCALVLGGDTLYGTTWEGGASGWGAMFAINTNGTGFTNLYSFSALSGPNTTNTDGAKPEAGLVLVGNTLYGVANYGGSSGRGTVFAIRTNGTGFTNLHSFVGGANDGANPLGPLILSSNKVYGTTSSGGTGNRGSVFAINTNGTGYTIIHLFAGGVDEGAVPYSSVAVGGNVVYGTTTQGGPDDSGVIFRVNTDGSNYTNLHSFTSGVGPSFPQTNYDGISPQGGLAIRGNTLYGMTGRGGSIGYGNEFAINTDGTGFTNIHLHTYNDGYFGGGGLNLYGNTLYGVSFGGGNFAAGTLFSLTLPPLTGPPLTITRAGTNVILTWPSYATGFILESATNLASLVNWSSNLPAPVIVNSQNTVTNSISGTNKFYRLIQ